MTYDWSEDPYLNEKIKSNIAAMIESSPTRTLTADDCIRLIWKSVLDTCDGVSFDVNCDQWWVVRARCQHGSWAGVSIGPVEISRAFAIVYSQFIEYHREVVDV